MYIKLRIDLITANSFFYNADWEVVGTRSKAKKPKEESWEPLFRGYNQDYPTAALMVDLYNANRSE